MGSAAQGLQLNIDYGYGHLRGICSDDLSAQGLQTLSWGFIGIMEKKMETTIYVASQMLWCPSKLRDVRRTIGVLFEDFRMMIIRRPHILGVLLRAIYSYILNIFSNCY